MARESLKQGSFIVITIEAIQYLITVCCRQFLEKQLIGFFRKHIPPHHDELLKANETIPDELVGEYAASHEAANDYDANDRPSPPKAHL